MHNLDKEILTTACMKSLPDSSWQIPSKPLESRTRKVDSSFSTNGNVRDNVEKNFDDLPNDSRASSKRSMGGHQTNTSTHLEHEETIFDSGNGHVSNNDSEDTSECHFKCWKIRPNPVYYDKANSHPLQMLKDYTQPCVLW